MTDEPITDTELVEWRSLADTVTPKMTPGQYAVFTVTMETALPRLLDALAVEHARAETLLAHNASLGLTCEALTAALEAANGRDASQRALLKRAQSCIWHHHEASYRPELGSICPVCCPDGDPYKSVLSEIDAALAGKESGK